MQQRRPTTFLNIAPPAKSALYALFTPRDAYLHPFDTLQPYSRDAHHPAIARLARLVGLETSTMSAIDPRRRQFPPSGRPLRRSAIATLASREAA